MDEHMAEHMADLKEKAGVDLIDHLEEMRDKNHHSAAKVEAEIERLQELLSSAQREYDYLRYQDQLLLDLIERGL